MKIRSVVAELFHADRETEKHDMTKLTIAFRNFAKAAKIISCLTENTLHVYYKDQLVNASYRNHHCLL
jgi:hypothetical protein